MKQLQYFGKDHLAWVEVADPTIESGTDALVRPLFVSRCELDRFIASGVLGWPGGFAFGHETYGEVVAVGDQISNYTPGDRVLVPFQISCGTCNRCRKGHTGLCERVPYRSCYGMAPLSGVEYGGGLSDLISVPFADHMLVPAQGDITPSSIAGVADNITTAYAMVAEPLAREPGGRVLIVGGNPIGLNAARFAIALGADKVVLVDDDWASLKIAAKFGAEVVQAEIKPDMPSVGRFPITIDATGTSDGIAFAIYSTDHEGVCQSSYGGFTETMPVPLRHMYGTNITLKLARVHARAHMPDVLDLMHSACLHDGDHVAPMQLSFAEAPLAMTKPAHGMVFIQEDV